MLTQVCFEHHAHGDGCFVDEAAEREKHVAWCREQCEQGWPKPGWGSGLVTPPDPSTAPRRHAPIKLDPLWLFCPLCGTRIR